jgi:cell division control protein 45
VTLGKSKLSLTREEWLRKLTDPSPSEFGLTFLDAKEDSGARTRHGSFDTNILEVSEGDFEKFIAEVYKARDKY